MIAFVADLCDLFVEKLNTEANRQTMHRLFQEVDALALEMNSESIRFLQRFSAMHIGAILRQEARSKLNKLPGIFNVNSMIDSKGIPADWAFTICNLIDAIHFFRGVDKRCIEDIRDFIYKSYAYKLQKVKRIAFLTNLFACLRYDAFIVTTNDILNIGRYILAKFGGSKQKNTLEVRIYLAFTNLILADQLEDKEKSLEYIQKANILSDIAVHSPIFIGLRNFLKLYSEMITDKKAKFKPEQPEHIFFMLPECKDKCNKAICASRHYKFSASSSLADLWLKRLDPRNLMTTIVHQV